MTINRLLITSAAAAVVVACAQVGDSRPPENEVSQAASTDAVSTSSPGDLPAAAAQSRPPEKQKASSTVAAPSGTGSGGDVFLAQTIKPVPVINVLSSGRLEVVDNCLTVLVAGERATAVFPPGARLERRSGAPSAVVFEGRRLPIGEDTRIPGGGVRASEIPLAAPIPANCPKKLFGLGG